MKNPQKKSTKIKPFVNKYNGKKNFSSEKDD